MRPRIAWLLPAALGLIMVSGCSSSTSPTAGTLTVSLTNPNGDDGALLLTISGGPVDSVEAVGYPLYSARTDANTVRLIVTGDVRSGAVARIHIPDARQVSRYVASVTQVAVRSTFAQRDTSGYAISLVP